MSYVLGVLTGIIGCVILVMARYTIDEIDKRGKKK
jgi:hypothetical protein